MRLSTFDWLIVGAVFVVAIGVSLWVSKRSSTTSAEFFLSGRSMPWWLLGTSMVATTFSTDTPNLVADITRTHGVAGNWVWWAFLLTGMTTTFLFASLWRRSRLTTDIEFYEMRYSGRVAAFLRLFRAIYLGMVLNVFILAIVCLAAIKIGAVLFGLSPTAIVLLAGGVALLVSIAGGLRGVIYTDFLLFSFAMTGAVSAAYFALDHPQVGGLTALFSHPVVVSKAQFFPSFSDPNLYVPLFLVPLLLQWWSVWYPGAEPGGGGYVAQRMLSAKNPNHAIGAIFLFNVAHYVLRPWPWIIVALASLVVFPTLDDIRAAFPHIEPDIVGHDLGYPAMLSFVPAGWLGLVTGSLIAAFLSTMSTSLNLGAAYITKDVYQRYVKEDASERELILCGRIAMIVLMTSTGFVALQLQNALQAFSILLSIGAGTGLIFMLRWYWERINAWSELTAMVVSFITSLYFQLNTELELEEWQRLLASVSITTFAWCAVVFITPRTDSETLRRFFDSVQPNSLGWRLTIENSGVVANRNSARQIPRAMLCAVLSSIAIYFAMFAIGYLIQAKIGTACFSLLGALVIGFMSWRCYKKIDL